MLNSNTIPTKQISYSVAQEIFPNPKYKYNLKINFMNFNYEIFLREEFISIYFEDESTIDIDIQDFWDFIKSRELNHYTLDYFNPNEADGHSQELGEYSYDEYFSISYHTIHADLVKFFKFNNINKYF